MLPPPPPPPPTSPSGGISLSPPSMLHCSPALLLLPPSYLTLWWHLTQAPHTPLSPLHDPDNAAVSRQPVQQGQGLGRRGRHGSCILPCTVLAKRPLAYGKQDRNQIEDG